MPPPLPPPGGWPSPRAVTPPPMVLPPPSVRAAPRRPVPPLPASSLPPPLAVLPPPRAIPLRAAQRGAAAPTKLRLFGPSTAPRGLARAVGARGGPAGRPALTVALIAALILGTGTLGIAASSASRRLAAAGHNRFAPQASHAPGYGAPTAEQATTRKPATATRSQAVAPRATTTPAGPTAPSPVRALGDNPIHRVGLGAIPVPCQLPRFTPSPEGQDAFYRAILPCLDAAWAPALTAANLPVRSPNLETITASITTPCGSEGPTRTAFYCPQNHTIYLPTIYYAHNERLGNRPGKYLGILAHEYGHHIQALSGVSDAEWDRRYEVGPDSPEGLELSRRLELQATCFAGMFIGAEQFQGAIDRTVANEGIQDGGNRGDWPGNGLPRDHGTPRHNANWENLGLRYNSTRQCDTWLANPAEVS